MNGYISERRMGKENVIQGIKKRKYDSHCYHQELRWNQFPNL